VTYDRPMARTRDADATRADILAAARTRFGAAGYERTTLRAVAADVGVDHALVIRYFGSKQDLFAAAADFTVDFADLTGVAPKDLAAALIPRFVAVWEDEGTFLALLRAAMSSPVAAETMRSVFSTQVAPALAAATVDRPLERAALVGAFMLGLATSRYILRTPGIAGMGHDELTAWIGPVVSQLLTGPAPGG
jgi:AcrR family transcriptional regulator